MIQNGAINWSETAIMSLVDMAPQTSPETSHAPHEMRGHNTTFADSEHTECTQLVDPRVRRLRTMELIPRHADLHS